MTFKVEGFSVPKLEERLADLTEQNIFSPDMIVIDGFPFDDDVEASLKQLKAFAEAHGSPYLVFGPDPPSPRAPVGWYSAPACTYRRFVRSQNSASAGGKEYPCQSHQRREYRRFDIRTDSRSLHHADGDRKRLTPQVNGADPRSANIAWLNQFSYICSA